MTDLLREFELQQIKIIERPRLKAGDIVRVEMKVKEGDKTRLQIFEGTILGIRGSGPSVTFTVRRETGRFGVERIFPLYNPLITNIEIVKRQKVRRAKLNYLRKAGRRRVKEDKRAMQRHIREEENRKRKMEKGERGKSENGKKKKDELHEPESEELKAQASDNQKPERAQNSS